MRAPILASFCIVGSLTWIALVTYVLMYAGWGDGATSAPSYLARLIGYLPSAYLLMLFTACIRSMPLSMVHVVLSIAGLVLVVFSIAFILQGQMGLIVPLPFIAFGIVARNTLWHQNDNGE